MGPNARGALPQGVAKRPAPGRLEASRERISRAPGCHPRPVASLRPGRRRRRPVRLRQPGHRHSCYARNQERFRRQADAEYKALQGADGFLFVTPEYNRSVPGVLKNAIDVGSRPYGKSSWGKAKPAAVVSVSPGAIGGFGANQHLRQSFVFLDVLCMQQPEAYLGGAGSFFDEQGKLNEKTRPFLQSIIDAFAVHVARTLKA